MKIDDAVLKKVEELARLRLEDDEKKRIFLDLQEILDAFSIIKQLDVENEDCSFIPIPLENTLMEDIPMENSEKEKEDVLSLVKNLEDNKIIGPRPIE